MVHKQLKKRCFVICPIGPQDSDITKRSDQILKYVINPPDESCGYDVIRGDQTLLSIFPDLRNKISEYFRKKDSILI